MTDDRRGTDGLNIGAG